MDIISFFSGCGGLDLGFKKAGFNLIWANEYDKNIQPTHEANFQDSHLEKKSILQLDLTHIPNSFGIIGGPPCQSFSFGGNQKGTSDPRGKLFLEYVKIIQNKKPTFFVIENVIGLMSEKHGKEVQAVIQIFKSIGYQLNIKVYNANDYGVAQDRKRVFIIGFLENIKKDFKPIESEPFKPTLKNALEGLDFSNSIGVKSGSTKDKKFNHEHMLGGFSSRFMSRNRVRSFDEPSFTIPATARHVPLHPMAPPMIKIGTDQFEFQEEHMNKYRRLSVRECARIQTFPDDFIFQYSRIEDGYKMIGNAVPVNLAYHIAKNISQHLFN